MAEFVQVNRAVISSIAISAYMVKIIIQWLLIVLPFFIFGVLITFLINVIQVGWQVSGKTIQPKFDKFNPITGFQRILSKK